MITLKNNDVIFFNGDSITDCLRDRNDKYSLSGYVLKIQEKLKKLFPELKLEIYNRGVSGNRSIK